MFGDLVDPFDAGGEDLGVGLVAKVAGVDAGLREGVGGGDVHGAAGEGVFEADEEGELLFALWGWGEELGLVAAFADVEAAGDAWG